MFRLWGSDSVAGSLAQAVHTSFNIVYHVAETWRDNDRPTVLKSSESTDRIDVRCTVKVPRLALGLCLIRVASDLTLT